MKHTTFAAIALALSASAFADCGVANDDVPDVQPAAAPAAVPALRIVAGCPHCKLNESAAKSLMEQYSKTLGSPASFSGEIVATITEFRFRSAGARQVLGTLAGLDRIEGYVTVNGNQIEVGDTARSSFCGIECVAANVGEEIAEAVEDANEEAQATN